MTTEILGHQIHAYVDIPTFELSTYFITHEVINLPEAVKETQRLIVYADSPEYLTVFETEKRGRS